MKKLSSTFCANDPASSVRLSLKCIIRRKWVGYDDVGESLWRDFELFDF
jgi:hypothetical protein